MSTNKYAQKNWSAIKANDSWALFKIMSEFVEGYKRLGAIGPCISIFGSARTNLIEVVETPEEILQALDKFHAKDSFGPNF